MKKFTKIFLTAVLLTTGFLPMQAQSVSPEKTIKVKIYLLDTFEVANLLENLSLRAVEREVNAKSPLRSTIEAQLAGATEEENSQLLYSPVSEINLVSVRVKNKTAYARFTRTGMEYFDKFDALRFRNAVRRTALQFPSVRKIEICLDGNLNFWREGVPKPCK